MRILLFGSEQNRRSTFEWAKRSEAHVEPCLVRSRLSTMDLTRRSQQTRLILQSALQRLLTVSGIKSAVIYYVVARYLLKTYRHIVGNGAAQSAVDAYKWISLVSFP
jgi:hypothetical protein